jgi:hypothetical protein
MFMGQRADLDVWEGAVAPEPPARRRVEFLDAGMAPSTRALAVQARWRDWDHEGALLADRVLPVSDAFRSTTAGDAVAAGDLWRRATSQGLMWHLCERDAEGQVVREALAREFEGRLHAITVL